MAFIQSFLFTLAIIVALLFALLVFVTGKGDAMSGGSAVRTTFKGKASFEDIMSRMTFFLGIAFMGLVLILDVLGHRTNEHANLMAPVSGSKSTGGTTSGSGAQSPPPANKPATETPKPGPTNK